MAIRSEIKTLREKIQAIRIKLKLLINYTYNHPSTTNPKEITKLINLSKPIIKIARNVNPYDPAWKFFDKSWEETLERINDPYHNSYVTGSLWRALEMVEGAISRAPAMPLRAKLRPLMARVMRYSDKFHPGAEEGARAVLSDWLEELGYTGEANLLRKFTQANDKKVAKSLNLSEVIPTYRQTHYPIRKRRS